MFYVFVNLYNFYNMSISKYKEGQNLRDEACKKGDSLSSGNNILCNRGTHLGFMGTFVSDYVI